MENDWLELTDEMITEIGYSKNHRNKRRMSHRSNLFSFIKSAYRQGKDYKFNPIPYKRAHNKLQLWVTAHVRDEIYQHTAKLRQPKKATEHFLYVLHNPAYMYYGPNVYKLGYSRKPITRAKRGGNSMLLDDSDIIHKVHVAERCAESMLFEIMEKFRIRKNREFFDCPLEKIKEFMETAKKRCEETETVVKMLNTV